MADVTFTTEQIKALEELGAISADSAEKIRNSFSAASDAMRGATNVASIYSSASKEALNNTSGLSSGFSNLSSTLSNIDLSSALNGITASIDSFSSSIGSNATEAIAAAVTALSGADLSGSFGKVGSDILNSGMRDVTENASGLKIALKSIFSDDSIGKLGGADRVLNLIRHQNALADVTSAIYKMHTASGMLNNLMDEGSLSSKKLDDSLASYHNRISQVSDSTGLASGYVAKLALQFGEEIPGGLNIMSNAGGEASSNLDALTASLKVAQAIGLEHNEMIKQISSSYLQYGSSIDHTIQNISMMSDVSQALGFRQAEVLSFVKSSQQGMEVMSDSTQSAILMLESLGRVLSDVGVSQGGVQQIVQGMISSTSSAGADLGKSAYISQMSGGPGGLSGAYEIERLKQEGNLAEIVVKAMAAFENMGLGTPVTLEEAGENQALAGQLYQQVEILKMFGLAKTDQEAYRSLDMIREGGADKLAESLNSFSERQSTVADKLEASGELSSRYNALGMQIVNSLDANLRSGMISSGNVSRGLFSQIEESFTGDSSLYGSGRVRTLEGGPVSNISGTLLSPDGSSMDVSNVMSIPESVQRQAIAAKDMTFTFGESIKEAVSSMASSFVNMIDDVRVRQENQPPVEVNGHAYITQEIKIDGVSEYIRNEINVELDRRERGALGRAHTGIDSLP